MCTHTYGFVLHINLISIQFHVWIAFRVCELNIIMIAPYGRNNYVKYVRTVYTNNIIKYMKSGGQVDIINIFL